ncbi:MAG: glutamate racemase [Candidatus Daviesbacteria bacterium]|nr:glutamate racemase [Candidatus Daviesbacteria bacterium]
MNNLPIGVFDSGIGGLTVAKEIIKLLPNESIIYLGDTARVPYGTRSKEVVIKFALELVKFLLKRKVKVLVVACNTISALALSEIEKISTVPVVGVVLPAVAEAVKATRNKRIGVIGTQGTIGSQVYEREIKKIDPYVEVFSVGCPLFVPLAEEGLHNHKAAKLVAEDYLDEIVKAQVDTLILGCTHYPLLLETIRETVGPSITLVDSAKPTALEIKKVLSDNDLFSNNQNPSLEFYVTDAPVRVFKVASRFFGSKLGSKIKKVTL